MEQVPVTGQLKETVQLVMEITGVFLLEFVTYVAWYLELPKDAIYFLQLLFVMQILQHQEFKIQRQIKLQYAWGVKNQVWV